MINFGRWHKSNLELLLYNKLKITLSWNGNGTVDKKRNRLLNFLISYSDYAMLGKEETEQIYLNTYKNEERVLSSLFKIAFFLPFPCLICTRNTPISNLMTQTPHSSFRKLSKSEKKFRTTEGDIFRFLLSNTIFRQNCLFALQCNSDARRFSSLQCKRLKLHSYVPHQES